MRLAAMALAGALIASPALATTYNLDTTIDGRPFIWGSATFDDSLLTSNGFGLSRVCAVADHCIDRGPWNKVSFDMTFSALQRALVGDGDNTRIAIQWTFDPTPDVAWGHIVIQSDTLIGDTSTLRLEADGYGQTETGAFNNGAGDRNLTMTWVRDLTHQPDPVPEPSSIAMLAVGLLGVTTLVRRDRSNHPQSL